MRGQYWKGKKRPNLWKGYRPEMIGNKLHQGHKHSDAAKELMRQKKLGRKLSAESRKRMSIARMGHPSYTKGMKFSAETRAKMSAFRIGRASPMKGRKLTLERRKKRSEARTYRPS